jgi:Fe-S-cluster containining protein
LAAFLALINNNIHFLSIQKTTDVKIIMLDSYFEYRDYLSGLECNFLCVEDCNAPGCWMTDVIVEVTFFDLIRLSLAYNNPVSILFSHYCHIGLQDCEQNPRYKRTVVKLKKPCHFLQEAICKVHESKPLSCTLFPEIHQVNGLKHELVRCQIFCKFPCLNDKIVVSNKRSKALKKLKKMSIKERAISYYLLFETPSFIIDPKPISRQLKRENQKLSVQDYERLIVAKLKSTGLFDGIMDEFVKLDTRHGVESLFEKLQDDALMRPLLEKMVRPEFIHRLKGDQVKRLRRNLQRPEVAFM